MTQNFTTAFANASSNEEAKKILKGEAERILAANGGERWIETESWTGPGPSNCRVVFNVADRLGSLTGAEYARMRVLVEQLVLGRPRHDDAYAGQRKITGYVYDVADFLAEEVPAAA